jgi:hypothetical protein
VKKWQVYLQDIRHFLFIVNLLWISLIKKKYVKLLTKNSVKDNINCEGIANISKILKCDYYVLWGFIPNIVLIILFCWRKTLLIYIELPQKIIPYTMAELKYAWYTILRVSIVL